MKDSEARRVCWYCGFRRLGRWLKFDGGYVWKCWHRHSSGTLGQSCLHNLAALAPETPDRKQD